MLKPVHTFTFILLTCVIFSSCTHISSGSETTIGGGYFVSKETASIQIRVFGKSDETEISYFKWEEVDDSFSDENYTPGPSQDYIEREFERNMESAELPWILDIELELDEVLYIHVDPVGVDDDVVLEIWKNGMIVKDYIIDNSDLPFRTTYYLRKKL